MLAWESLQIASKYLIKNKRVFIIPESFIIDKMYTAEYPSIGGIGGNFGMPIGIKLKDYMQLTLRIDHNYTVECTIPEDDFNLSEPCIIDKAAKIEQFNSDDDKLVARVMYMLWAIYKDVVERRRPDSLLAIDPEDRFIRERIRQITRTM